ncbi:SWIM zinc finger family protein [Streptomyces sp. JNUCC 64]
MRGPRGTGAGTRAGTATAAGTVTGAEGPPASGPAEGADRGGPGPVDPVAARRRAERRAARITAGAGELERRIEDVLRGGLATAGPEGRAVWEETAARMVDAQAPGLAARARELAALPGSGPGWQARMLEECALLRLLALGWLRRDALPEALAATVRARVGLPSVPEGEPVPDRWLVLAHHDHRDDRLTTRHVWVHGAASGRTGVVLSYTAPGRTPAPAPPVGGVLTATAVPRPGTALPRLELDTTDTVPPPPGGTAPGGRRPTGGRVPDALAAYGAAVAADPWAEEVAVTVAEVVPVLAAGAAGDGRLVDPATRQALPLTPGFRRGGGLWRLVSLAGGTAVTVFGEVGHRGFRPLAAWLPDGPVVPLT